MRIWKTVIDNSRKQEKLPGTIESVEREGMLVNCGAGMLKVLELQFDSGKRMSVASYIAGHDIDEGEVLE